MGKKVHFQVFISSTRRKEKNDGLGEERKLIGVFLPRFMRTLNPNAVLAGRCLRERSSDLCYVMIVYRFKCFRANIVPTYAIEYLCVFTRMLFFCISKRLTQWVYE